MAAASANCQTYVASIAPAGYPAYDCSIPVPALYQKFMSDINQVWNSNEVACPCNTDALGNGCYNNAFVTPASPGYEFYDQNFLDNMISMAGNRPIAAAIIMAHETGHNIQLRFGLQYAYAVDRELAADCFAGFFLGALECSGAANMNDAQAAFATMCAGGDPAGYPWFASSAHGSCTDRENALFQGYNGYVGKQNPLSACALP